MHCFDVADSEDVQNVVFAVKAKDCFECSFIGHESELCFNMMSNFGSYNSRCSFFVIYSQNVEYSKNIISSKNIFGCVSLRHKEYCIFNKQYSETEYKDLRQRIIDHMKKTASPQGELISQEWGSFFPGKLSDFAYNETTAHDYFPLTKEEAMAQGYLWKDEEQKAPQTPTVTIPDNIADVDENITKEILQCDDCKKNYKILNQEVDFYKKSTLPIPRLCSNCRHKRRMEMKNPRQLWPRKCQKCGMEVESSYSPERSETVYCEKCYLSAVYT